MTERVEGLSSSGLPEPDRVGELLSGPFAEAGYEIEAINVDTRARPPRLRIVVDGDNPLDLEAVAELSRSASTLLDALDTAAGTYLLEVSSPGVDRPLTEEKHFRRARGRKVDVHLADGTALTGRLGAVSADPSGSRVDLVVPDRTGWLVRGIALADIRRAVVQVEFSQPSARELELAGAAEPTDRGVTHP